ncbi:MAG: hypothetical protein K0T53_00315 [Wolbachia pipientis]|nr:hypothetical protein [Wolbachia pipientis]
MEESIWGRIHKVAKNGVRIIKNISLLPFKAFIYPIKKTSASIGEMQHDIKVSLKEALGINVSKEEKKYSAPIKITKASKSLGVQIIKREKGLVIFLASRTLTGNLFYLTGKQLNEIEKLNSKYLNININKESNKIVITVNIEEIINDVKSDSRYEEKSPEKIKQVIVRKIYSEAGYNLKAVARITCGEFITHTDRKLLHGIEEALFQEGSRCISESSINHSVGKLLEESLEDITSRDFNITNPNNFPYRNKKVLSSIE